MSKVRKAKRLRQPNVPMSVGPVVEAAAERVEMRAGSGAETSLPDFDYTNTKKDLTRIGLLAGAFIAILVTLSFFIR